MRDVECASSSPTTTASTRRASPCWSESRAQLSDDVWIVAPGARPERAGAFADAQRPAAPAPDRPRSASRVRGTPTDCVIMAVRKVLGGKPDLVLSGVNGGQNIADDVTYSGTVAGAIEGTLLGIPSMALSQAFDWDARPPSRSMGDGRGARARHHRQADRVRLRRRPALQRQFPEPPARQGHRRRDHRAGPHGAWLVRGRAPRRTRQSILLARVGHRGRAPPSHGTDIAAIDRAEFR